MSEDLVHLAVSEASQLIAARKLSPVELVDAVLKQIDRVEARVKSYILVDRDRAREKAKQAEAAVMRGGWRGALHGIPYGVKDNYFTKGLRTCANSRVLMEHVPDFDATLVSRLNDAGAVLMGKLNTWEFGTGTGSVYHDSAFDHARNPWRENHFTGGSSTGSGAAVAAGTALFALGADTGGSVRLPAAGCGLHGLKPTYGVLSRHGILPNCWSLDVPGPLASTALDTALVMNAIAAHDPLDGASVEGDRPDYARGIEAGVKGLRIGVMRDFGEAVMLDPAVQRGIDDVLSELRNQGAVLVDLAMPMPPSTYRQVTALISGTERATVHEREFTESGDRMGRELREAIMTGMSARAVDYVAAQRRRRELAESMDATLRMVDAIILPCAMLGVPSFDDAPAVKAYMTKTCTTAFNVTGHPAHSFPTGFDERGLPTSAQVVGHYFAEAMILRVAHAYERARDWTARRPPV